MGTRAGVGVAAAVAVCAVGLWAFWDLTIDDAYITFRYSQHLAEGHGPVWNVGQDPVQGYTNLLWMLLLAPAAWAGWSLPVAAKVLGIVALAGTLWQTYVAAVDWSGRRGAGVAAVAALLVMVPTYVHTVAGLETMLYAGLLVRFVWSVTTDRPPWERAVLAVVLGMVRPEGWAVAGAGMLYVTWRDRDLWPLLASGAGVTAVVAWQWSYYGSPVPNTFFVKVGEAGDVTSLVTLAAVTVVAGLLWLASDAGPDRSWVMAALALAVVPYLMSDLMMDYAMRFAYHVTPLAVAMGAAAVFSTAALRPAAGVAFLAMASVAGVWTLTPGIALYGPSLERAHVALGQTLSATGGEGMTVAVGDAGAIPYYSGWPTLDTLGLNDERIARGIGVADRIGEVSPDVIVGFTSPSGVVIGQDPTVDVSDTHTPVGTVQFREGYVLTVLVADDVAAKRRAAIREGVEEIPGYVNPINWPSWRSHLAARL